MPILSLDPGVKNFAYAAHSSNQGVISGFITPATYLDNTEFLNDILELINQYNPDVIVAERYQYRGVASIHSELVNQMLGMIQTIAFINNIEFELVAPSTWKRWAKKQDQTQLVKHKNEHQQDAIQIGQWYLA